MVCYLDVLSSQDCHFSEFVVLSTLVLVHFRIFVFFAVDWNWNIKLIICNSNKPLIK